MEGGSRAEAYGLAAVAKTLISRRAGKRPCGAGGAEEGFGVRWVEFVEWTRKEISVGKERGALPKVLTKPSFRDIVMTLGI